MLDNTRVIITHDVRAPDGVLRVQAGARGTIRSYWGDRYGVLFDPGQEFFVEPEAGGHLFRHVPCFDTMTIDLHNYIQSRSQ